MSRSAGQRPGEAARSGGHFLAVGGRGGEAAAPPAFVGEIPGDGFIQAGLKGFAREKAQLGFHARGVDGIAPVVAGAVLDEADQACARLSLGRDGVRKADLSGVWVSAGVSLS